MTLIFWHGIYSLGTRWHQQVGENEPNKVFPPSFQQTVNDIEKVLPYYNDGLEKSKGGERRWQISKWSVGTHKCCSSLHIYTRKSQNRRTWIEYLLKKEGGDFYFHSRRKEHTFSAATAARIITLLELGREEKRWISFSSYSLWRSLCVP